MAMKKIPKSFMLRGQKYSVSTNGTKRDDSIGLAKLLQNKIYLDSTHSGEPICSDQQRAIFWHEAAHMILHVMDEHELNDNEKFVNQLGTTIQELIESIKY